MISWGILIGELLLLSISSKYLFTGLFIIFQKLIRNRRGAMVLVALLFLPGVVIHELSHMLVAEALFVRTKNMEFKPVMSEDGLKLGSVQVAKSDIVRRLLIGIAPFLVGTGFIVSLLWIVSTTFTYKDAFSSIQSIGISLLVALLIFIVANTMFSSKKDLEGLVGFAVVALIILGGLYFAGLHVHELLIPLLIQEEVVRVVERISLLLLIPVGINIVVLSVTASILKRKGIRIGG